MLLRVVVGAGALLRLRSTAATIALPGAQTSVSHAEMCLEIAGRLDIDLQPTVVAADAVHRTAVVAAVDRSGAIRLRERVQIGRTGEGQGFWTGSLRADVDGQPLLRHRLELGAGGVADDVLGAPRACVSELRYPDGSDCAYPPGSVRLELARGGILTTWLGDRLAG
jgi:urease accessory protein